MGPHDARLVPAAIAAYGTAGAVVAGASGVAIALGALVVAVALLSRGRPWATSVTLAAAVALLVALMSHAHLASRWHGDIDQAVDAGPVLVSATLIREPQPLRTTGYDGEPRVRVALHINAWAPPCGCERPTTGATWRPADATITVIAGTPWDDLPVGERVIAATSLSATGSGRDIAVAWDAQLRERAPGAWANRAVAHLREKLRDATAHLAPEVRALTRGMVIGDTADMSPEQVDSMRRTSLAHLTAVSGAHFAIVLMATAGLMRAWRWPRKLRAVLAGTVMAGFATLVFPEPSVLRAFAMSIAVCAALWWGRPAHALPALAAGVIVLLVIDPYLALSFGFALSVSAVASIVLWAPILASHLQRWVTPSLASVMAIPCAAQVVCAPILVLLNPGVGIYGVAANIVAVTFAVPVTLLGLIAVLAAVASAPIASAIASVAGLAARPIVWVAEVLSDAPGAWVSWPSGWWGAATLALLSATVIAATTLRQASAWWRAAAVVTIAGLLVGTPAVRDATGLHARTVADWDVIVCDVGQGHMMMLRADTDSAVVVDVGSPRSGGVECLRTHGIRHVPLLILTHPHSDHDGAVSELARVASIGAAWVSPTGMVAPNDDAYRYLVMAGVPVTVPSVGDTVTVGAVTLTVWHPGEAFAHTSLNDASIVVSGSAGEVTVLNLGDLEEAAQRELLDQLRPGIAVDVVLVAHHGSARQHRPFVTAIDSHVAVVGVGADNRHGHPAPSALELYGARGAVVLRTDECGDVIIARREQLVLSVGCPHLVAG